MSLLAIGSVALDDIKTPFGEKKNVLGGAASHFSVAASFQYPVSIVGIVGKDFPQKHLKYLQSKKINTDSIAISDEPTFHWSGHYEYDMNTAHTDNTVLGAFATFSPVLTREQRNSEFVFLGNIDPELQWKILSQLDKPRFVGLDSMNYWISSKKEQLLKVLRKVDVLFLNDAEIRQLSGEASLIKAARAIQKKGPRFIAVKKGEHGVMLIGKDFIYIAPAFPTDKLKDPTGAGDSFAGGFVSYYCSHLKKNADFNLDLLKQATVWGSAVASFAVEGFSLDGLNGASKEGIRKRCHDIHSLVLFNKHK